MGGKVEHPFRVEVWEGDKVAETLAVARNAVIGIAAYEAAVKERPGRSVTLSHGARIVRSSTAAQTGPPTVAMLKAQGVAGVRLWCVGCGHHAVLTWAQLKAGDDEPFPTAGRPPACSACGGREVTRMPDWPGHKERRK
jgi:hypothetical protein